MASGLPNTDPRKGRPTTETSGKGGAETKAMMDSFDGVESAVVEQLALIAGFTEVMKNYIPKLGFIDAHTAALKLKQDQAFKVLEKIEEHVRPAEVVEDEPEPDAEVEEEDVNEDVDGPDGEREPDPEAEEGEDTRDPEKSPLEQIAKDVHAIKLHLVGKDEEDEDNRDPTDPPDVTTDTGGGDTKAPKGAKKVGAIGKFLNRIGKLFSVFNLIVVGLIASLLTANADLFTKIKELFGTIMQVFTQIVGLVVEKILPVMTQVFGIIIDLVNQLLPPLMDIFGVIVEVGMQIVEALIDPLMAIVDMLVPVIVQIVDTLVPIIMSVIDAVMPIIEMILDMLIPIVEIVLDIFMFLFETIMLPIFELLTPIVEFVGDLIMGFFNMLISVWNGIIEAVAFVAGFFGKGDEVRAMKMDKLEKDESRDVADQIDFSQDDEAVDAQIQAKLDSGEINKKTAEKLREKKDKFRKQQAERRAEMIEKLNVQEVEVAKADSDGEKIKLIQMDLSELTDGALGQMMFDPESLDENGNYQFYTPEGAPVEVPALARQAVMMAANAAVEGLQAQETGDGSSFDMMQLLGLDATQNDIGNDIADESLDTAEAQDDAASAGSAGGQTNISTNVGGSTSSTAQKTVILSDGGGDVQGSRGFVATPN